MRNVAFALAVGFGLAACGGDEKEPPKTPAAPVETAPTPPTTPVAEAPKEEPKAPSMAEMQKKTLTGYAQAMAAHDAKQMSTFYTENATVQVIGMPEQHGRDAVAAHWQKMFDAFSNVKSSASRILVKNDVVITEWAWTGKHTGDLMGMKATEKDVGVAGADVMWFDKDGLIKEDHVYHDMGTIMSQVGASKQKARPVPALAPMPQIVMSKDGPEEAKNVEVAKQLTMSFDSKKEADFTGPLADDVQWDDMTQPETMKGKDAGKKFFGTMTKAFPDLKTTVANTWGIGDFVVVESSFTGTQKGAFFGVQPTKKTVTGHGLDIMQMKDGKVVKGESYSNSVEMLTQLGLMPMPGDKGAKTSTTSAKPPTTPSTTKSTSTSTTTSTKTTTPAPKK